MQKIFAAVLLMMLLTCACETTSPKKNPEENESQGPIEVKIGGEVRVQGEYRDSN